MQEVWPSATVAEEQWGHRIFHKKIQSSHQKLFYKITVLHWQSELWHNTCERCFFFGSCMLKNNKTEEQMMSYEILQEQKQPMKLICCKNVAVDLENYYFQ